MFDEAEKLQTESRLVASIFLLIYLVFTILQFVLFPGQSLFWHLGIGLLGLFGVVLFGVIVWIIDVYLDKSLPLDKNITKRILIQFLLTVFIITTLRVLASIFILKRLPIKVSPELIAAGFAMNIFVSQCEDGE